MTSCWCDYDTPEFFNESRPLAAKAHRCDECGRVIKPGERYERVTGKWDGDVITNKTCVYCLMMRDILQSKLQCFCWLYEDLREQIYITLQEESCRFPGLAFEIGRIEVERSRDTSANPRS